MSKFIQFKKQAEELIGKWFKPALAVLTLSFIFFIAGGGVSQNDRWRIDSVTITGANAVSSDTILKLVKEKLAGNYFFVYARENSALYPRNEIEKSLLEIFPRIASAETHRVDAHTIAVSVTERKPYALWCGSNFVSNAKELSSCWFIDNTGFVFDQAPVFSEGVYLEFYGPLEERNPDSPLGGVIPGARFLSANTFVQMAQKEIGEPLRVVLKEEGETEVTIHTSTMHSFLSDVTVRFKDSNDPAVLVKNLLAAIRVQFPDNGALKKKLLYIDMRFGNKIFFGFNE